VSVGTSTPSRADVPSRRRPSSAGLTVQIVIWVTTGPGAIAHAFLTGYSSQLAASGSAIDASRESSPLTADAQAATASRASLAAIARPNQPSPASVITAAATGLASTLIASTISDSVIASSPPRSADSQHDSNGGGGKARGLPPGHTRQPSGRPS
jgi:hypothetical protein